MSPIRYPVSDALIAELTALFPAKPPSLEDTDREVWFKAGQRSVVDFLIRQKQVQEQQGSQNVLRAQHP